ncbi:MAG: VOC family protein [Gammaproteobacteria bacterium]|nr:VOC family protein [Gammaproteobacteria bacterium]
MELNQVTLPTTDYGATLWVHAVDELAEATGVTLYFEVDDVDVRVRELEAAGLVIESQPLDQRWLWREAYLRDPAGNVICIFHGGENRRYPPWRLSS